MFNDWYQIVTEALVREIERTEADSEYFVYFSSEEDGMDRNPFTKDHTHSVLFKFDWSRKQ